LLTKWLKNNMDWVIKILSKPKTLNRKIKNNYNYDQRRLRFCKDCKKVWELTWSKSLLYYDHLPTYGLPRKKCKYCKNK